MYSERFTLRLNKRLKEELQIMANEENKTLNSLINELLEEIIIIKINDDFNNYKLVSKQDLNNMESKLIKCIKGCDKF